MPTNRLSKPRPRAACWPWVVFFAVAGLSGCAATSDNMGSFLTSSAEAFAVADGRILRGQARLTAEREGTVALQSIDGAAALSCFGPLRYTATVQGEINMQCSDGRSATLAFQSISPLTGTGRGRMEKPDAASTPATDVTLTYGLTADNAAAFLGVARERLTPPAGNAAVNSTPIANGNTMPAPLAQP